VSPPGALWCDPMGGAVSPPGALWCDPMGGAPCIGPPCIPYTPPGPPANCCGGRRCCCWANACERWSKTLGQCQDQDQEPHAHSSCTPLFSRCEVYDAALPHTHGRSGGWSTRVVAVARQPHARARERGAALR
jgi:hypothetical protein